MDPRGPPARRHSPLRLTARLLLASFRLDGEDIIRLATGKVVPTRAAGYTDVKVPQPNGSRPSIKYHRLKFLLLHGWLPALVDHEDGNPANGAGDNLRPATRSQNKINHKAVHAKRSLPRGVYPVRDTGRFQAQVKHVGRYRYLGMFPTASEASAVVEEFLKQTHGNFYVEPPG